MSEIGNFKQPDTAPPYFIDFLDFLDNFAGVKSFRSEAARRMKLVSGLRILDVGCGIGGAVFPLAEITGPNGLVAGVDISSALIGVAAGRAAGRANVEFRLGDAGAIPYPDGFFDVARSERVFLYLPDRLAAIREMKRVVKPGGKVWLMDTDFDCTGIYSTKPALTRKMTSIVASSMPNPNSARELPALAKQADLRDIEVETFSLTTPYEFFVRAMAGSLSKAAEDGLVARSEVDEWLEEQAALQASGDFFQMWLFVMVGGTV